MKKSLGEEGLMERLGWDWVTGRRRRRRTFEEEEGGDKDSPVGPKAHTQLTQLEGTGEED